MLRFIRVGVDPLSFSFPFEVGKTIDGHISKKSNIREWGKARDRKYKAYSLRTENQEQFNIQQTTKNSFSSKMWAGWIWGSRNKEEKKEFKK